MGDVIDTLKVLYMKNTKSTEITSQYLFGTSTFEEVTDQFPLEALTITHNKFQVRTILVEKKTNTV